MIADNRKLFLSLVLLLYFLRIVIGIKTLNVFLTVIDLVLIDIQSRQASH